MKWYEKQKKLFEEAGDKDMDKAVKEVEAQEKQDEISEGIGTKQAVDEQASDAYEATIISKGTVIQGDISTKGDLQIRGSVYGNICCEGHLELDGEVQGNLKITRGTFLKAQVSGYITCREALELGYETVITGDIQAQMMKANSRIKGNIHVETDVVLDKDAVVEGDVEAQFLKIEHGATLQGQFIVFAQQDKK